VVLTLDRVLAPFTAAAILALIGAVGIWSHHPWLVPSLGSAAFIQTMIPDQRAAKPWSTVMGQLVALGAGFAGVYAAAAQSVPPLMSGHTLIWARIAAVGIAIWLTVLLQQLIGAQNPAGGATALLMAVGTEKPTLEGAFIMVVGILLVSALGEAARFTILTLRRSAKRCAGNREP
jgi:hypothetical protein